MEIRQKKTRCAVGSAYYRRCWRSKTTSGLCSAHVSASTFRFTGHHLLSTEPNYAARREKNVPAPSRKEGQFRNVCRHREQKHNQINALPARTNVNPEKIREMRRNELREGHSGPHLFPVNSVQCIEQRKTSTRGEDHWNKCILKLIKSKPFAVMTVGTFAHSQ